MIAAGATTLANPVASAQDGALVPSAVDLAEPLVRALDATWLSDDERADLRVMHGVWSEADLNDPDRRAGAMVRTWRVDDPVFARPDVSVVLRAEALALTGAHERILEMFADEDDLEALDSAERVRALRLVTESAVALGDDAAANAAASAIARLVDPDSDDADVFVDRVRARAALSRLESRPAAEYRELMEELARVRTELDRLHPGVRLVESALLLEKHNIEDAARTLHEALRLDPRSSEAWHRLGRIALRAFDFGSCTRAQDALRRLNPDHPLADLLEAEAALMSNDPDRAIELLDPLIARMPESLDARAMRAAADAVAYDFAAARARLSALDERAPTVATAWHLVGRHLSLDRQYDEAASVLAEAVERRPGWSAPRIELGLLEMQAGRDDRALAALERAVELDPFNERAAFSLRLLQELAAFEEIESEHFIIRYRPGVDAVVARMMPDALDAMHEDVAARFQHEPDRKTIIEVMPDHRFFSVRITGMPWVHTIAACTGPLIAMEVPREGPPRKHLGLYDWLRVLRHEYTHTITLSQTRNRIPHWLTEAAAVSMELGPRTDTTARMLASAWSRGELFDLDEINWAFVRPRKPTDRSMAYAQGHWMVEFMNERWGEDALVELLGHYFDGRPEREAIPATLGISRGEFLAAFLDWAGDQVRAWGLAPEPALETLVEAKLAEDEGYAELLERRRTTRLRLAADAAASRLGRPGGATGEALAWPTLPPPPVEIEDGWIANWIESHPEHPDVLELAARRAIDRDGRTDEEAIELLERYRTARPVDPWPDRVLARLLLTGDEPARAIPHLDRLDLLDETDPTFAVELARLRRAAGDSAAALVDAERAVRTDPYRPEYRELAAAAAIESSRLDRARLHLEALALLEPDRARHQARLEALERLERSR